MKIHGYIYILTNKVNGKMYIGQTTREVDTRIKEHINVAKKNIKEKMHYLHYAIKKYGKDNFSYKTACACYSQDMLNEMELSLIIKNKTLIRKYGYNLRFENEKGFVSDTTRQKISEWQTGRKLTEEHKRNVSKALKGREVKKETREKISTSCKTKIAVKCLETGEIFESYSEAARKYNCDYRAIKRCCTKDRRTTRGKHFVFTTDKTTIEEIDNYSSYLKRKSRPNKRKVYCVDLDKIFNTVTEAYEYCKGKDGAGIIRVCREKQETAYGHKWRYV